MKDNKFLSGNEQFEAACGTDATIAHALAVLDPVRAYSFKHAAWVGWLAHESVRAQPQGEPVAWMFKYLSHSDSPPYSSFEVTSFHQNPKAPGIEQHTPLCAMQGAPRPIRFADMPLPVPDPVELLRDALDHIAKTCHQSRQQSRRIRWIEARANSALEGKPYDEKLLDLPVEVDREIDRFKRRDRRQLTRIREFDALLRQTNELFYAIQDELGAVTASAVDVMRGKVFTALGGEPETCTWSQHEFSWSSTCGMDGWEFTDGGTPAENGMKFCHCCGKPIAAEVQDDE
tara:strand:+ start:25469 stop:26332 length:864 start_codon:yes stop_codon:yes gene_type:complete